MTSFLKYTLFILIICFLAACKSEPSFKTVAVDFLIQHPEISIEPATFDTLTEYVLVRDAHFVGATFETVTEYVLERSIYRDIKIMDIQFFNILADQENGLSCAVPCINYYSENNVKRFEVLAEYSTRTYEKLVENGTGAQIPAEYKTRQFLRQLTDATINPVPTETLEPLRKIFRIPIEMDFDTYWQHALVEQGIVGCGGALTYVVVEL